MTSPANVYGSVTYVDKNVDISGYWVAANPKLVKAFGYTHILKLFEDDDTYYGGYHRHPNVTYMVVNAMDSPKFKLENYFASCLDFIQKAIARKGKILIHCHAGISRSATIVLLYLMTICGLTLDKAMALLKSKREIVRPNAGFMTALRKMDERLKKYRVGPPK